ncbi:ribonucleotide-diphosphate reductase alpha subunit [alpha proteobacterium BAL199]|jgi:histidine ammonia-lyase|nr:ribonucleotide-diphosphate reductase alpha subunit [alpha proteobacterium BAL199]
MTSLTITPGALSLADLRRLYRSRPSLTLDPSSRGAIADSAATVARVIAAGKVVYGINTGFGKLAQKTIPTDRLEELQKALVRSHCAGVGDPLGDNVVFLIMALKANGLGRGHSGIRGEVIDALLTLANAGVLPVIPSQGSVGASGDLAPLAHLSAVLIGEGEAHRNGERLRGEAAMQAAGLDSVTLAPKEGLALLNGTQVSTALGLAGLFEIERVFNAALVAGAMTVDASMGSDTPFDARIHALRAHPGQSETAAVYRRLLHGSAIRASHLECDRVQDPYSLRCQPQVMGAVLDHLRFAAGRLAAEANAVSDNPLVFSDTGEIMSGGNFHAEPVAFAADQIAIVASEIGAMSERRTAMLMDVNISSLPPFLVAEAGINSGFMIAQVTAAALQAETKLLTSPASVDSLPTSANQEDHVSMATHGARRLLAMAANLRRVVAVELLCAAQGIDLRRPLTTSPALAEALAEVRAVAPFFENDRQVAPDIEAVAARIGAGAFDKLAGVSVEGG